MPKLIIIILFQIMLIISVFANLTPQEADLKNKLEGLLSKGVMLKGLDEGCKFFDSEVMKKHYNLNPKNEKFLEERTKFHNEVITEVLKFQKENCRITLTGLGPKPYIVDQYRIYGEK